MTVRPMVSQILEMNRADQDSGNCAADERSGDWNRRVAPVGGALVRNRQKAVSEPRAEIARRVDGVSGGASERQADAPDRHKVWAETSGGAADRDCLREDGASNQHQHELAMISLMSSSDNCELQG
jgi:hypothetical protein